jgi:hypothetical protein
VFLLFTLVAVLLQFVFRKPLLTIIMAPKIKVVNAGSASKPKRSHDVPSISEEVKILDMIEIEKKSYAEIARLYGKNKTHNFYCLCSTLMEKHPLRIRLKRQTPLLSEV